MAKNRRKKKHPKNAGNRISGQEKVPKSFVFRRGKLTQNLRILEKDIRKMMLPYTAQRLKENPRNTVKDFLHVSGPLGVSHFLILSSTAEAPYLRVAKTPRGPTLTFKILNYSLMADVVRAQLRPRVPTDMFEAPPLVVMNGLSGHGDHLKLLTIMFQNIFPAININTIKLSECKRVLLLNYNKETDDIDVRHYGISAQPVGVSRNIRKLVQRKKLPDLSGLNDISEFVARSGYGSESEVEDEASRVQLSQDLGRANRATSQSAVKLSEVGPRLKLQLIKVEEGLCTGTVMYHKFVRKTPEEIEEQKEKMKVKAELKAKRKAEQEANVAKKKQMTPKTGEEDSQEEEETEEKEEVDDDVEYYRQEVGEEPDEGFMVKRPQKVHQFKKHFKKRN